MTALAVVVLGILMAAQSADAVPAVRPYGQVARFGSFDEAANYTGSNTSGLSETVGGSAKLVYPVGMAVEPVGASYAIFVLDLVNPQALEVLKRGEHGPMEGLSLEYRIQEINPAGTLLAVKKFTLGSAPAAPGLHAVSLAVDATTKSVYVMIADIPPTEGNREAGATAAYAVDEWSAANSGQLVGPTTYAGPSSLQPGGANTLTGDVRGESLVVDDAGGQRSVAIAGGKYNSSEGGEPAPVIERIAPGGGSLGAWEGATDVEATEDEAAKYWRHFSSLIYAASADPNGSINVTLGQDTEHMENADEEPNMAIISGDLTQTTATLPWVSAMDENGEALNADRAATVVLHQETEPLHYQKLAPSGASTGGGTLAPSVVQLAGEGSFPSGLYAGVVAHSSDVNEGLDRQSGRPYSWVLGGDKKAEVAQEVVSLTPASLAIRVFDAQGESLGMIGNVTPGGACNIQGGPYGDANEQSREAFYEYNSFVALAAGREGTLFALVQPDLDEKQAPFEIDPALPLAKTIPHPLEHVQGDEVVEFQPGKGTECPQPSGGFSIAKVSPGGKEGVTSTGSGPVTVAAGTTLKLASEVALRGGSPWSYEWNPGEGEPILNAWRDAEQWKWPSPSVEVKYPNVGTYTAQLKLTSDSGPLVAKREVKVVEASNPTACFTVQGDTAGQRVKFDASCSQPPPSEAIVSYHWRWGTGIEGEIRSPAQAEHIFSSPGTQNVTLTVTSEFGHEGQVVIPIEILPAPITKTSSINGSGGGSSSTSGGGGSSGGSGSGSVSHERAIDVGPTDVSPAVASTASVHGTVAVRVSCPAGKPSCSGTITLESAGASGASAHKRRGRPVHARPTVIGRAPFHLLGGQSETVQVRLSRSAIGLLRTKRSLTVLVVTTATDPAGHAKTVAQTITLHPARRSASHRTHYRRPTVVLATEIRRAESASPCRCRRPCTW